MKQPFLVVLISLLSFNLFAQTNSYTLLDYNKGKKEYTKNSITKAYERKIKKIKSSSPKRYVSRYKEIYTDKYEDLILRIDNSEFIFDPSYKTYFDSVFYRVVRANPSLPKGKKRLLISRSHYPNATCLGDGTFIINIGLIRRLKSENELAFVFAHELAHYYEDHVDKSIEKYVVQFYSYATQQQLKQIRNSKYNVNKKATALLRNFTYDAKRHSRDHEVEADSIGVRFLLNAGYNLSGAYSCMETLSKVDEDKYDYEIDYKGIFHDEKYPFKSKWLEKEELMTLGGNAIESDYDADSLKTHPNIEKRTEILNTTFGESTDAPLYFYTTADSFQHYIRIADFEVINSTFQINELAKTVFYALKLQEKYPENTYLKAMVSRCFYEFYVAKENHTLSEIVPLVEPEYSDDYKQMIEFIRNLRMKDLVNININYIEKAMKTLEEDDHLLFSYILALAIAEDNTNEYRRSIDRFIKKYKSSPYYAFVVGL